MRTMVVVSCLVALVAFSFGCSEASRKIDEEATKEEIKISLESYLPLLGEAYATGNLEFLRDWAAEKEMARVYKRVDELAATGRTLVPTFRQLTVEEFNVWNYSNAYVTTLEIWDLEVYATGTEQILSQEHEQPNRVKYQLKREDGRWRVLFRTIQDRTIQG
jgi:hypothetical protein